METTSAVPMNYSIGIAPRWNKWHLTNTERAYEIPSSARSISRLRHLFRNPDVAALVQGIADYSMGKHVTPAPQHSQVFFPSEHWLSDSVFGLTCL